MARRASRRACRCSTTASSSSPGACRSTSKIRGGEGKWLLRRVLDRHVPRALIDRPKMGFGVPIDAWLRGPLRDWAEDLLAEARLRARATSTRPRSTAALREHLAGRRNWQYQLWAVLMFQAWLDQQRTAGSGGVRVAVVGVLSDGS